MRRGNFPDIDPANNDTLAGSIRFVFKKMLQDVNGTLPAEIISYNRKTNRAQVKILIAIVGTDGTVQPRPQIASIPVLILGGGNVMLSFALKPGNLGWVIANDRDISLFLQTYTQAPPNTPRLSNFADALFVPDQMRNYVINDSDTDNAVFSTTDGLTRIVVGDELIQLIVTSQTTSTDISEIDITPSRVNFSCTDGTESSGIEITPAGMTFTGAIGGIELDGTLDASGAPGGTLHVHGAITASGSITPDIPP